MSVERCDDCERAIDTDMDVECYIPLGPGSFFFAVLCHVCREKNDVYAEDDAA
jgi:hypothetical protein